MSGVPFQLELLGSFARSQVEVTMTGERRAAHPEVDALISAAWDARVAEAAMRGQLLFAGPMCALLGWTVHEDRLTLRFGLTDYREFVGTNVTHPEVAERFGTDQLANGTGVCSVLETADDLLILQRRSETVFEHPGMLHVCGGSLDPAEREGQLAADPFAVMAREFTEELGIAAEDLTAMRCLGLARDGQTRKPDLLLHTRTALPAAAILGAESEEHSALVAVPVAALAPWLTAHWDEVTPAGLACLVAYQAVEFATGMAAAWR